MEHIQDICLKENVKEDSKYINVRSFPLVIVLRIFAAISNPLAKLIQDKRIWYE